MTRARARSRRQLALVAAAVAAGFGATACDSCNKRTATAAPTAGTASTDAPEPLSPEEAIGMRKVEQTEPPLELAQQAAVLQLVVDNPDVRQHLAAAAGDAGAAPLQLSVPETFTEAAKLVKSAGVPVVLVDGGDAQLVIQRQRRVMSASAQRLEILMPAARRFGYVDVEKRDGTWALKVARIRERKQ